MITENQIHKEFEFLTRSIDRGELRKQQIDLSKKIADTINNRKNGIFQAGTGVGKSFAYLIPAILSGRSVVISTATKQLSSQIASKDLKILKDVLFPSLKYSELQGIENYVCMQKVEKCFTDGVKYPEISMFIGIDKHYEDVKDLPPEKMLPQAQSSFYILNEKDKERIRDIKFLYKIMDCYQDYSDGKITYKDFIRVGMDCSSECARRLSCKKSKCFDVKKKSKCEFFDSCPYKKLCEDVAKSQILVTNHAFIGTCLSGSNGGTSHEVIRNRDLWIADEGHELEQYLIKCFSEEISTKDLRDLLKRISDPNGKDKIFKLIDKNLNYDDANKFKYQYNSFEKDLETIIDSLKGYSAMFRMSEDHNEQILAENISDEIISRMNQIKLYYDDICKQISDSDNNVDTQVRDTILSYIDFDELYRTIVKSSQHKNKKNSYLFYLEYLNNENQDVIFHITNIKVGEQLQACIGMLNPEKCNNSEFEINPEKVNLITLSATMKIGETFDDFKDIISADKSIVDYDTYDAGTVFNYKQQGILYVPENIPDLKKDRELHFKKFQMETVKLINSSNGGALVLTTTSYEADQMYELLNKLFGSKFNIFNYKESSNKDAIIERFRLDRNSVLVGTKGFFQGIDVQGTSLRLVCINKIPFPTPTVVSEAKSKIYQGEGKNAFQLTSVIPATQTLLQAIGRLIRHTTDNGVIAIMDNRLNENKFWLKPLIDSIPDFYRTSDFNQIDNFFRKMKQIM